MPWRLDPGNDLILNMHLKPSGKPETVAAQIGLYFTATPPSKQPMLLQLEHDSALNIPPGAREFIVEDQLKLPVDVDVLGIYPHAHYLGKDLQAYAILPNGQKTWLIWIRNWDIDRQSVYRYRKPVFLPKGTTIHMHYIYDNSRENVHNPNDPPIRVRAGNRSVDEMGHLWLQVLPVNTPPNSPDPRLLLETAWMENRLRKEPRDTLALYNLAAAETSEGNYARGRPDLQASRRDQSERCSRMERPRSRAGKHRRLARCAAGLSKSFRRRSNPDRRHLQSWEKPVGPRSDIRGRPIIPSRAQAVAQ